MDASTRKNFVIIGAGPVGLLTALAVAQAAKKENGNDPPNVVVYERRANLEQKLEESYPIGIAPRGCRALQAISPPSLDQIRANGVLVDSWDIYAGARQVASVKSGTTLGHTRYSITNTLYQQVIAQGIQVKLGHQLTGINISNKNLTFKTQAGNEQEKETTFDCSTSIVVAADGSSSATRRLLGEIAYKDKGYAPTRIDTTPWEMYFRVLVMDGECVSHNEDTVPLKPESHSIYNGVYTALIGPPKERKWVVVPSCKRNTPEAKWFFMETNDPSPEMMNQLRHHLAKQISPLRDTKKFFTDTEITAFFSRRLFTGSLISLSPLSYPHDEKESTWIVFLGDSAHGVFPATGEGLNSGLDDVYVFCQTVLWPALGDPREAARPKEGMKFDLTAYSAERQPDVDALSILAKEILTMTTGSPKDKAIFILTNILTAIARSLKLIGPSEAELRYGPYADRELLPYREVLRRHIRDTCIPRATATAVVSLFYFVTAPFRMFHHTH